MEKLETKDFVNINKTEELDPLLVAELEKARAHFHQLEQRREEFYQEDIPMEADSDEYLNYSQQYQEINDGISETVAQLARLFKQLPGDLDLSRYIASGEIRLNKN